MHQRASTEICPAEPASSFQPATWSDPVKNTHHPAGTTPHTLPGHLCVPAMRRAVRIENDKAIGDRRMAPHHRLHGRRRDPALRGGKMKVCGCIHYTRWAVAVGGLQQRCAIIAEAAGSWPRRRPRTWTGSSPNWRHLPERGRRSSGASRRIEPMERSSEQRCCPHTGLRFLQVRIVTRRAETAACGWLRPVPASGPDRAVPPPCGGHSRVPSRPITSPATGRSGNIQAERAASPSPLRLTIAAMPTIRPLVPHSRLRAIVVSMTLWATPWTSA